MKARNLLKKAFLLLALMGGATSAWGADAVSQTATQYKGDFVDGQVVWLTRTGMSGKDWITIATASESNVTPATDPSTGSAYSGDAMAVYRVKQWSGRYLEFWVTGVSSITFYANHPGLTDGAAKDERIMKATVNQTSETSPVTILTVEKGDIVTQGSGTVNLTANANNKIRVYATGDMDLYAMKVTVPAASVAPSITSNLASSADAYVGVPQNFSITATGATSYQWYKASSTTADIENDDAIGGATTSSYSYTAGAAGTEYLYCAAINAIGTTVSTVCAVTATSATFHSVTYSLGSGSGTVPTQADVAEGDNFTVANVPGDLTPPTGKEFKCWNDGTSDYDPGAAYPMSTSNVVLSAVYQDRTFDGLTPTSTLDLSNASSTTFTTIWFDNSGKMSKNYYYDAPNGIVVMSAYAIYQGKNQAKVSWMDTDSGNSSACTWDATGVFKGNAYYFNDDARAASIQQTARIHYYRVTNCTGVSALTNGKSYMAAYEVNAGVVSPDPADGKTSTINGEGTLSITGLDKDKEYVILVRGNNGTSGIRFYEIAFNFPPVASTTITPANNWSTYVTPYALDFSDVAGLKAYVATDAAAGTVTLDPVGAVPAGTPLMLVGTASTEYTVPVIAPVSAPGTNMFRAGDGTTVFNGSSFDYILYTDGLFYQIGSGTVATNKAYLHCDSNPTSGGARELRISFGDDITGIEQIDNGQWTIDNSQDGKFIENGKLVIVKNGVKYNAAGAKLY